MEQNNLKKNMLWNAAGNIIYLACQWLITVLVARNGSFEDAGILSLAMSISATFQTLALFGIRNFQVSDIDNKYTDTTYVSFRIISCAAAMAGCLIFSLISGHLGGTLLAILLFMLFRLSENFADVLHGIAQKKDRLDIAGKAYAVKGIGALLMFVGLYMLSDSLNLALAAMAIFSCLSTVLYDTLAVRRLSDFKPFGSLGLSLGLARETWPLCVYLFLTAAISTVPKLVLELKLGIEILGIYSTVFAPALLIAAAAGYLYAPFVPLFAEHYKNRRNKDFLILLAKIMSAIAVFAAAVMLAAVFLGDFAMNLLFGDKIAEHTYLLLPILIAIFANSVLAFLCILSVVFRDFVFLLISCGAGLILELAITGIWLDASGINAASYSYICGCALSSLMLLTRILYILKKSDSN